MRTCHLPQFPGRLRKNDAVFMYGALQPDPFVYVYEPSETQVVYGPSCRLAEEICLERCRTDDIECTERRGGGGTVVLGSGMVVTVIVGERDRGYPATAYFNRVHRAMVALLEETGIDGVYPSGISDLAINNRKILGSSLYMGTHPLKFYYQSSLLVAPDLALFERYLKYPPREPDYRRQRSHSSFCTSLREEGFDVAVSVLTELFATRLPELLTQYRE